MGHEMKSIPWKEEAPDDATQSIIHEYSASSLMPRVIREHLKVLKETQSGAVFSWSLKGKCWDVAEKAWSNILYTVNHIFSRLTSLEDGAAIP